ncbi:hypothetical protein KRX11_05760 [Pasteurellaceae bacterium TAE3-ERU1]|nr:hypothetical protein [Pasteurellaceae bacterium TAE3-ERU1]
MQHLDRTPSARFSAVLAILCFAPVAVMLMQNLRLWWLDYPGIFFHLALFFLVARLDAPVWGKAAGYGWLLLDVTVGVMTLNHVSLDIAMPIRLGGHIFAGIWLMSCSYRGSWLVRVLGFITGLWLFGFTFVAPALQLPMAALAPASLMTIVWLAVVAWKNGVE